MLLMNVEPRAMHLPLTLAYYVTKHLIVYRISISYILCLPEALVSACGD